jgi:hypothetical protein
VLAQARPKRVEKMANANGLMLSSAYQAGGISKE